MASREGQSTTLCDSKNVSKLNQRRKPLLVASIQKHTQKKYYDAMKRTVTDKKRFIKRLSLTIKYNWVTWKVKILV